MTTMDFNTRLALGLLVTMILGLVVLFITADSADAAHTLRSVEVYLPYGV